MLNGPRLKVYGKSAKPRENKGYSRYERKDTGLVRVSRNRCTADTSPEALSPFSSLVQDAKRRPLTPLNSTSTKLHQLQFSPLTVVNSTNFKHVSSDNQTSQTPGANVSTHSDTSVLKYRSPSTFTDEVNSRGLPTASTPCFNGMVCSSLVSPDEVREIPSPHSGVSRLEMNISNHSPTTCSSYSLNSSGQLCSVVDKQGKRASTASMTSREFNQSYSPLVLITPCNRTKSTVEKPQLRQTLNSLCESLADCNISGQHTPLPSTPPSVVSSPLLRYLSPAHALHISDQDKILSLCQQEEAIPLGDIFSERMISTLTKLGEGTFAEVFGAQDEQKTKFAMKIVPIEGDFPYNGETQSSFKVILPEMVVTREMSMLGDDIKNENFTTNFLQIHRMSLCCGKFPQYLLDVWDTYDKKHSSENDRPDVFPDDQLYIVFVAKDAGTPLDEFEYNSFDEANSILNQLAATLAVGEAALEFEHRDLHQGNILVQPTQKENIYFRLNGVDIAIETHGVLATIVDYTLSRICQASCVSYNNLNKLEWLFTAKGDLQFDVYREMRDTTKMDWKVYCPFTNVLWLHYVLVKISQQTKLSKKISTRAWRAHLRGLSKEFLDENSTAKDVLNHLFLHTR